MFLLLLLSACTPTPCDANALAPGTMEASLAGKAWATNSTSFFWATEVLQVSTDPTQVATDTTGEKSIILSLGKTRDGTSVRDALEDGSFPVDVELTIGDDDAVAYFYRADHASHDSRTLGGSVTLSAADVDGDDDDFVQGCFSFDVQDDLLGSISIDDGKFYAIPEEVYDSAPTITQ